MHQLTEDRLTEILGGIGHACPGPLVLVDHLGRKHPLNPRAKTRDESAEASEAFLTPVRFARGREGQVIGYVRAGADAGDAALVSALSALAAELLTRMAAAGEGDTSDLHHPSREWSAEGADDILAEACDQLSDATDEEATSETVARAACEALRARTVVIFGRAEGGGLTPLARAGELAADVPVVATGDGLLGWAATRKHPTAANSVQRLPESFPREAFERDKAAAWLDFPLVLFPLRSGSQLVGLLCASGLPAVPGVDVAGAAAARLRALAEKVTASVTGALLRRGELREERVARELDIARRIQGALLAQPQLDVPGLDFAAACRPAAEVGGDYVGFRSDDVGELTVTAFDVAGHGIGAALCMTMVRAAFQGELARGGRLSEVLARANKLVFDDLATPGLFATSLVLRFDAERRQLRWANAGHPRPVHWSASRREFVDHPEGGLPLGLLHDSAYPDGVAAFDPGDVFVAYTDGVVEAVNEAGEPFGRHRLLGVVRRSRRLAAGAVLRAIWRELEEFCGSTSLADDATVLVVRAVRRRGCPEPATA